MSLGQQTQFQPQSTGTFGGSQNSFGGPTQQFQGTSNFGSGFGSPPSADVFGSMQSNQNFRMGPSSTTATQGSFTHSSSSTSATIKSSTGGFGAFQSSENDAWSMGHGLGKSLYIRPSNCSSSQPGQYKEEGGDSET